MEVVWGRLPADFGELGVSCVDFGEFGIFCVQIHADFGEFGVFWVQIHTEFGEFGVFSFHFQPQGATPGDAPQDKSKPWEAGS